MVRKVRVLVGMPVALASLLASAPPPAPGPLPAPCGVDPEAGDAPILGRADYRTRGCTPERFTALTSAWSAAVTMLASRPAPKAEPPPGASTST